MGLPEHWLNIISMIMHSYISEIFFDVLKNNFHNHASKNKGYYTYYVKLPTCESMKFCSPLRAAAVIWFLWNDLRIEWIHIFHWILVVFISISPMMFIQYSRNDYFLGQHTGHYIKCVDIFTLDLIMSQWSVWWRHNTLCGLREMFIKNSFNQWKGWLL